MKILLIDDSLAEYELLKDQFEGAEIDWVNDVNEAITRVLKDKYDIILIDYRLKFFDGIYVLNQLSRLKIRKTDIYLYSDYETAECDAISRIKDLNESFKGVIKKSDRNKLEKIIYARI